jgi:hypothetical protein
MGKGSRNLSISGSGGVGYYQGSWDCTKGNQNVGKENFGDHFETLQA